MTAVRRYLRGAGLLIGQTVFMRVVGMFTNVILSRGLSPAALGQFASVQTTASTGYGMVRLGVENALHLRMAEREDVASAARVKGEVLATAFVLMLAVGGVGALVLVGGAGWLARSVFGAPELTPWLRAAGALLVTNVLFQYGQAVLAGFHAFARLAAANAIGAVAMVAGVAAGLVVDGLRGAVTGLVAANVLLAVIVLGSVIRELRARSIRPSLAGVGRRAPELLRLGVPLYLANLLAIPVTYFMQGLLTREAGVQTLGALRIITTLTTLVTFIPTSVTGAALSSLSELRTDESRTAADLAHLSLLNVRVLWFTCLVIAFLMSAILPALVTVLFGAAWLPVVPVARISIFGAVLASLAITMSTGFFAERRTGLVFAQTASFAVAFGLGATLLIPRLGLVGYAVAELTGWAVACAGGILLLGRMVRARGVDAVPLAQLTAATAVSFAATLAIPRLVAGAGAQVTVLLALAGVLGIAGYRWMLNGEERQALRGSVQRLRSRRAAARMVPRPVEGR